MNEGNRISSASVVALMSIAFITMGVGTITPAIQSIASAHPLLPVTTVLLVSTLPSLLIIPASLIAGIMAGTKVKYKTLSVFGILLFILGGVMPAYTNDSFMVILIERAVFGIGLGIISPLGNALILGLYEGQKRASMFGLWTVIANVGGIVLQFLGGYFAGIKWYYSFYPHLLGIISLVLVILFLPEPGKVKTDGISSKSNNKISLRAWIVCGLFGLGMLFVYPLLINMSTYLVYRDLGGAAVSGVVLAFYTIGGMAAGAVFGYVYKASGRYIVAVASFIMAVGLALILYGGNVVMVTVGVAFAGFSFSTMLPTVNMILGMIVNPESFAFASSVLIAVMNLTLFLATYWIGLVEKITGDSVVNPMFIGMIVFAAAGIVFTFLSPISKSEVSRPNLP